MQLYFAIPILILVGIFEFIIYPRIVEKIIHKTISSRNGRVISIEKISARESIYNVMYVTDFEHQSSTFKFNIFFQFTEY